MRKLLCVACGYTAALLLAHYLLPWSWLLPAAGVCAALAAASFLLHGKLRRAALLALCAAFVGFGWYYGYTHLFIQPAEDFVGEECTIAVRVADYPTVYDDYSVVEVRSVDAAVPHVRMLVYDYSAGMGELRPGDLAELPLKLLSAAQRYHEDSDYYLSEGVLLRGYLKGEYHVTGRAKLAWLYFPQEIARSIRRGAMECFPSDVAPLMKALLTGDKREYYEDDALYTAMKRAGFSHIIAVSGMHVAFLVSALSLLCGRRRRTAFLGIPAIIVFMAMVGFTPSVVRAGVMQILLLIAPLLGRENDPLTSLSAAALLLLLCNPVTVASISFQLSFAAMAGLILVSPRIYDWCCFDEKGNSRFRKGFKGRILHYLSASFSASVGAIVFTTPLSALWFGFVPVYSVLTNLLCLWAMSAAFLLGYPVCLLGLVWLPLGRILGWIAGWLPRYAVFVVKLIAKLPMAAVYTRGNLCAWWLVFVYVVFLVSYLLKGDTRYRPLLPLCACIFTLILVSWFPERRILGGMELSAVDVGQGQSLAMLTEKGTVLIDCGSTGSAENAGDAAADFLMEYGRQKIDLLVLTHFHADHANGVKRLLSRTEVARLAYPTDCEANEYMDEILSRCEQQGTELFPVSANTDMDVDGLTLRLYAPLGSEDVNEHCLMIRGDYGEFEFLVTGDAGSGVERLLSSFYDLGDLELLVVGHHGSRYSTCDTLLEEIRPEAAIISVGAGNSYGHPTPEVLERLAARKIDVYRTDLDGTITITVGETYGEKG